MDKKIGGLLGAVAGLATMGAAHAATPPAFNPADALHASSYSELLAPVANAVALVRADDAAREQTAPVQQVDYYRGPVAHHHHHHHHHHHQAYNHHHHHHHHHQTAVVVPGVGGIVVGH
ncbi:MAG TPA: hypothetical protein VGG99_10275 [Acetobacteraceae bacterium]|jgi:hypothetical protein